MEKLVKIQNELKAPKNQFNSFGKYKYRSCEDILEALKPLLLKYNCSLVINDEIKEDNIWYTIKEIQPNQIGVSEISYECVIKRIDNSNIKGWS